MRGDCHAHEHNKTIPSNILARLVGKSSVSFSCNLYHSLCFKYCLHEVISCSYSVIVWVRVVLKVNAVYNFRFDNLSGSHLQSQAISVCQSMVL